MGARDDGHTFFRAVHLSTKFDLLTRGLQVIGNKWLKYLDLLHGGLDESQVRTFNSTVHHLFPSSCANTPLLRDLCLPPVVAESMYRGRRCDESGIDNAKSFFF